jgi:hypothetical protein
VGYIRRRKATPFRTIPDDLNVNPVKVDPTEGICKAFFREWDDLPRQRSGVLKRASARPGSIATLRDKHYLRGIRLRLCLTIVLSTIYADG